MKATQLEALSELLSFFNLKSKVKQIDPIKTTRRTNPAIKTLIP